MFASNKRIGQLVRIERAGGSLPYAPEALTAAEEAADLALVATDLAPVATALAPLESFLVPEEIAPFNFAILPTGADISIYKSILFVSSLKCLLF